MSEPENQLRIGGEDGKIVVEGTEHALGFLAMLIGELMDDPEETVIRAVHARDGQEIVIRKVK